MAENENSQENAQENAQEQKQQGAFALQRVYVKDTSFESPNSPVIFQKQWKPETKMDLNTKHKHLNDNFYEIVVTVTLTTTVEDLTAYIVEVQQAGICLVQGIEGPALAQALNAFGPNLIFPYLRETIDNILVKGSFPPAMLAPVNFDAIWAQAMIQQQQQQEATASADESTAH